MKSLPSSRRGVLAFVLALLSMSDPFAVAQPPADLAVRGWAHQGDPVSATPLRPRNS
jgi:hypothetical protein